MSQQPINKPGIYHPNIPLQQVYYAPVQEFSPVYDSVKNSNIIEEQVSSSKQDLNTFEEEIEASVLAATFYKTKEEVLTIDNKMHVKEPTNDPVLHSRSLNGSLPPVNYSNQKTYTVSSQENHPRILPKNIVKKLSSSSKIQSKHENERGISSSSVNTVDSLRITTGISGKPYSYAQLITYAIATSSSQKMTLSELYKWCIDNFPYFKEAPNQGWKNSIRHNLSLNRNFVRIPRPVNEPGKGSYWTLNRAMLKNGTNAPNRSKNYGHYNTFSKEITFNPPIKLNGNNNSSCRYHAQLPYQSQKNTESISQSSNNNFNPGITSSPGVQKYPVSMPLSMQPYNMPLYDANRQANTQYCLDSACYPENNKTQEELLFNLLQYQQFKIQQTHKIAIESNKDSLANQSIPLHQTGFRL